MLIRIQQIYVKIPTYQNVFVTFVYIYSTDSVKVLMLEPGVCATNIHTFIFFLPNVNCQAVK